MCMRQEAFDGCFFGALNHYFCAGLAAFICCKENIRKVEKDAGTPRSPNIYGNIFAVMNLTTGLPGQSVKRSVHVPFYAESTPGNRDQEEGSHAAYHYEDCLVPPSGERKDERSRYPTSNQDEALNHPYPCRAEVICLCPQMNRSAADVDRAPNRHRNTGSSGDGETP